MRTIHPSQIRAIGIRYSSGAGPVYSPPTGYLFNEKVKESSISIQGRTNTEYSLQGRARNVDEKIGKYQCGFILGFQDLQPFSMPQDLQ
jgi:hypothetical protein